MIRCTEDGINWYEDEFPPMGDMISKYYGNNTWNECMLFHEFAVNMYDLEMNHKGKRYIFYVSPDGVIWANPERPGARTEWDSPVEFIKDFEIDGKKLFEIVNEIDEMNWM